MSCLTELLRSTAPIDMPLALLLQAADELERLNGLVALQKKDMKGAMDRIADLEAALREISEDGSADTWAADLAIAALQEVDKED